jgi:hypothetical protein
MGPAARNLFSTPASRLRAFAVSGFHVTALLGFSVLVFSFKWIVSSLNNIPDRKAPYRLLESHRTFRDVAND